MQQWLDGMESEKKKLVAEQRKYGVLSTKDALKVVRTWLQSIQLENAITYGLPEIDDRYHYWRIPLLSEDTKARVGEVVIDAYTSLIVEEKTTGPSTLEQRLLRRPEKRSHTASSRRGTYRLSPLRNTIALGDSREVLLDIPAESVNLVFTSPPYFNARPEYEDYVTYEDYLAVIQQVIRQAHRVLSEGAFFVMNVAPVLVRRTTRNESSQRIAVPFDMHALFSKEGFDFIDDIIWLKPEGAGWATGRGRRFAADRNPLQYKAVPVTEYVLVYRKHTEKLIDWNIRAHPDKSLVEASKIRDPYERTNVWEITPTSDKQHPAVFPVELAEKVITYYSFRNDVILDPFAGVGTVGAAAAKLGRRFVLIEKNPGYVDEIRRRAVAWMGSEAESILCLNCPPIVADTLI